MSRTWSPRGHRARHTPSPPTAPRPRGGKAGSAPIPPPRGRGHELIGLAEYRKPPEGRESAHQTVSPDLEHAASPRYGRRSLAPIRRLGAPSPRRSHKTPTFKLAPSPSGVLDAHLHDAVRGLGCRHLHPHLLLQPPRPPLLRTPPGPPYTGGSMARPPRPYQEISLAMEAARLGIPFSNWAN